MSVLYLLGMTRPPRGCLTLARQTPGGSTSTAAWGVAAAGVWVGAVCVAVATAAATAQSVDQGDPGAGTNAAAPMATIRSADDLQAWAGETFRIRRTDHFMIAYDGEYDHVRPLTGRVEATYAAVVRMCESTGIRTRGEPDALPVVFFDLYETYRVRSAALQPNAAALAGFYNQNTNLACFFNTLSRPDVIEFDRQLAVYQRELLELRRQGRSAAAEQAALQRQLTAFRIQRDAIVERINRLVIQHEVAHQVLFNLGVHSREAENPGWLVEGLACQFEVPQRAHHAGLGAVNETRLAEFRQAFGLAEGDPPPPAGQRRAAFETRRFLPLTDLIGDAHALASGRGGEHLSLRYAQAWSLVLYLHRMKREAFAGYVNAVASRPAGFRTTPAVERAEFERAFGAIDDAFEAAWLEFVFGLGKGD